MFTGKLDNDTIATVRQVIADWDGQNELTIRHTLRALNYSPAEIDAMSWADVRQTFAVRQKQAVIILGGRPQTSTGTVKTDDFSTPEVSLEMRAIALLAQKKEWRPKEMAVILGCEYHSFYKMPLLMAAVKRLKQTEQR